MPPAGRQPPPYVGAPVVSGIEAAIVVSAAVIFSDNLVFWIGRTFGRKLTKMQRFKGFFESAMMTKIRHFAHKYGVSAAFIFRFTPGIRFPAHVFLGMSHFSALLFFLVDAFAVSISVPTQILLIDHFGNPILDALYKFKVYVAIAVGIGLIYFVSKKIWSHYRTPTPKA